MAEVRYDVLVDSWSCLVTNQSRKAFGGRKIRQRTVRYRENLVGQVAVTLESGPEVGSAPQALTQPG